MSPAFWVPPLLLLLTAMPAWSDDPARFGDALHEKFHHARCIQCHQFNSGKSNGRAHTSHRARYLCDNCHTRRITGLPRGEWQAPGEKLDYTGLGPAETCQLIKRNLGPGDPKAAMTRHLLEDARIRWALESGMTPAGRFPPVPGGYEAWAREVKAWIDGGMLCE
jgi:hypothetical protein